MYKRHISRQLAPYLDGLLEPRETQQVEVHLRSCEQCRAERDQIRLGMAMIEHLPQIEAPESIWSAIEAGLADGQSSRRPAIPWWRWALAAAAVMAIAGVAYWRLAIPARTRWEVVRIDGSPSVAAKPIRGAARIGAGDWIETDAISRAMLKVGEIGSVEVGPNTRVRVVTERPGEHRLALAKGEIQAKISAPPKLFFVETASGTAVDLGCEYALNMDEDGSGLLKVTKGWVSFQWKGLESLVPAGASCRTHAQAGPGIPYFDDASDNLKEALDAFGFEKASTDALSVILHESRVGDTLTLWHLLSRVDLAERNRVFDRIAALTPLPAGVSREQVLKLDPQTLNRWKEELAWTW